jgi:hypothetical protein
MPTVIKIKRGTSTPSTGDITSGEIAIDTSARKLYINDSGTVKEIGGASQDTVSGEITSGAFSNLNTFTSDYTVNTSTTRTSVLFGSEFDVSSNAEFDVGGSGTLELVSASPTNLLNSALQNSSITIGDESSNSADISLGDELSVIGGANIDTAINQNLFTVSVPKELTGPIAGVTQTASVSGSTALDFDTYQNFVLTLTGDLTLANPSTESVGQTGFIILIQDGTGNRSLTLGTDYETAGGSGLTISTAASAVDLIPYYVKASNSIMLTAPQLAFS